MREKVSGIGKEIALLMKKNNISLNELEKRTGISKKLLKDFIELRKEPYVIPEGQKILPALGITTSDEQDKFLKKWIEMAEKSNEKV